MKSTLRKLAVILSLSLALASVSKALVLDATSATALAGDPNQPAWGQSSWLFGNDSGGDFGAMAANWSVTKAGDATSGFTWTINMDTHVDLSFGKLHAGGPDQFNYLVWSGSDFDAFNATNDLTITFKQNYFANNQGKYYGISGIGVRGGNSDVADDGGGGDDATNVPDSGGTMALLGLAAVCLGLSRRLFRA